MDAARWQDLKRIVEQATALPKSEWPGFLDENCGGNQELRAEIESLLRHHTASNPLDQPAAHYATELLFDPAPETLGAYRITSHIGLGGTSDVYLAERADGHFEKQVAVKILRAGIYGDDMRRRFQRERQILADLDHPNIVRLMDGGITPDGRPYLVEEHVEGPPVTTFATERRLNPRQRLDLFLSICEAVAYAHSRGVVHRDLKPSNILTTVSGMPKLVDFGVAGLLASANGGAQATISQHRYWTPAYSSPEHALGEPAGPASDVYSLGLILCEILSGRPVADGHPAHPSGTRQHVIEGLPRHLRPIAARCLEQRAPDRYADAQALLDALRTSPEARWEFPGWSGRRVLYPIGAIAAGAVLLVAGWLTWPLWAPAPPVHNPRLLASDPVHQTTPSLSPDGRWVAFDRSGELVLSPLAGGALRKVTERGNHPRWSPDGKSIAFCRSPSADVYHLFFASTDSGAVRALPGRFNNAFRFEWHPDSRSLCIPHRDSPDQPFRIFRVDAASGEGVALTSPRAGEFGDTGCSFSPDGRHVAFSRYETLSTADLWVAEVGGGPARRLTLDGVGIMGLDWTPDGREIVFASHRSGPLRLWRIQARSFLGARPYPVTLGESAAESPSFQRPASGARPPFRLVFQYTREIVDIWKLRPDGRSAEAITSNPNYDDCPSVSPDGQRVAFVSNRTGAPELWTALLDGARQVRLSHFGDGAVAAPGWSPDGKQLVFAAQRGGQHGIYVIAASGGDPRMLTQGLHQEGHPSWSADGRFIYFRSARSGANEIWKMAADGSRPAVPITQGGGYEGYESPDGRWLYYVKGIQVPGLWRTPAAGGAGQLAMDGPISGYWAVSRQGVHFIDVLREQPGDRPLLLYRPETGLIERIAEVPGTRDQKHRGFSVSQDGRSVLYVRKENSRGEIMLIDDFR